jgi:hypothetical protein
MNIMKKTIIVLTIACSAMSIQAQKINAAKVPAPVKAAFAKQYPGRSVKWEMEDGKYEAGFINNGASTSILYDARGTATETEVDIKANALPAAVIQYVKTHYAGKSIKEGAKITKADGTVNYEAEVSGKDLIFDAKGTFLKEVKD